MQTLPKKTYVDNKIIQFNPNKQLPTGTETVYDDPGFIPLSSKIKFIFVEFLIQSKYRKTFAFAPVDSQQFEIDEKLCYFSLRSDGKAYLSINEQITNTVILDRLYVHL